jgi:hypothetical protein
VPRVSNPSESFVERLTGAMRVTTLMKGVYDLVEMFSMHRTLPGHEDPVPCFQEVALWVDFAELAYSPNGRPETRLSEVIPLWVETIEEGPVVDNGSDIFPSWGHVVDIESARPDSVASVARLVSCHHLGRCSGGIGSPLLPLAGICPSPMLTHSKVLWRSWIVSSSPRPRWVAAL